MVEGVYTALLTPFSPDGTKIDRARLAQLIEIQVEADIHGLVACGSTGEFATMSTAERKEVVELTCEVVDGRIPVIAQTGSPSTAEALELSGHAAEHGAAALLLAVPYYGPVDEDDIIAYYGDVAEAVDLPLMAYNFPAASGVPLGVDFLARLAGRVPAVRFVKDSSGDERQLLDLAAGAVAGLSVWCGEEALFRSALDAGVKGFILGAGNVAPRLLADAYNAARTADTDALDTATRSLEPLFGALADSAYTGTVKAAVTLLSGPVGPVRRPMKAAGGAVLERLSPVVASLRDR
ncbi:dihydrodipicolinate synthase family protein [Streptomyces sp. NPDC048277]|uniref:dihydrodipicolinate synthase family protein n=1 Tax=Streptomyces sp. NPDC048277 TaxID=3155027 RepID=UPI0033D69388